MSSLSARAAAFRDLFAVRDAELVRDRLRLLCRVGQLQRADAGQPALSWFQLLPFTGEGRRRRPVRGGHAQPP